jgi:hypothetical protein
MDYEPWSVSFRRLQITLAARRVGHHSFPSILPHSTTSSFMPYSPSQKGLPPHSLNAAAANDAST